MLTRTSQGTCPVPVTAVVSTDERRFLLPHDDRSQAEGICDMINPRCAAKVERPQLQLA